MPGEGRLFAKFWQCCRAFMALCQWVKEDSSSAGLAKALDMHVAAQEACESGQPSVVQAAQQLMTVLR